MCAPDIKINLFKIKLCAKKKRLIQLLGIVVDAGHEEGGEGDEGEGEDDEGAGNDEMADACADLEPAAVITDEEEKV